MSGTGAELDIRTLGGVRVAVGGRPLAASAFGYAKPRELLCFLLECPDATKARIGAAMWPWSSPARFRSAFHTALHHLRAALPPGVVRYADGRYAFDRTRPYRYDVERFEALAASGTVDGLAAAVRLYGGDYLEDQPGEQWTEQRRDALRRTHRRVVERLAALHAAAGDHNAAIDLLTRIVVADPLCESAQRDLMRYYAASGDTGAALRQFASLRLVLREELSADPAAATAALGDRIRRGEPMPV